MHDLAMRCFHLSPIVHVPWQGQMIAVLLLAVLGGATAARRLSGQGTQPMDVDAQPLCSATIYYGASVGDASKKETADVPIYVGRFDVVVAQPQSFVQTGPGDNSSRWVLGWKFTDGEYLQYSQDVFGDEGVQKVFMSPNLQQGASGTGAAAMLKDADKRQSVAVFSNTSLDSANPEVIFSFIGCKGPATSPLPNALFRVAPPTYVFINNHNCWPLFRPQGSSGNSSAVGSGAPVGRASPTGSPTGQEQGAGQQQDMVEIATPRLSPDHMPKQLQVEYLPVELVAENEALFAKTATQFYFRVTNTGADVVHLDQVVLQYWFNGPLDGTTDAAANDTGGPGASDAVARVSASQFRVTCSDATAEIGCGGLAWNVTPGLPTAFGARYVLNIWFPALPANGSGSTTPQRFALQPASTNSSAGNSTSQGTWSLADVQAIVAIEPRRFFANISATNDYSYLDTPVLQARQGGNSSEGGIIVRHKQEPNVRMPAYIAAQLAWGSPPVGGAMAPRPGSGNSSAPGSKSAYPPGSYCQPSPGGGLVCGVDVVYCCLGSGPLNLSGVPADWRQRLA